MEQFMNSSFFNFFPSLLIFCNRRLGKAKWHFEDSASKSIQPDAEISLPHCQRQQFGYQERMCVPFLPASGSIPPPLFKALWRVCRPFPVSTYHLVPNQHPILDTKFCSVMMLCSYSKCDHLFCS